MAQKFAFTMVGVGKIYPPNKQVLRDIYLSFYYGAKIGVLGLNGSGKSTLMKIMAGVEKNFNGEAHPSDGITVGYLQQEPELDDSKTVRDNVLSGMGPIVKWLKRFEEIGGLFSDPDLDPNKMDKLLSEQADLQEKIEHANGWDLDRTLDIAMDALRLPPGDVQVKNLSGGERRRVALCRLLLQKPDILLLDEPTNHLDAESVGWLEQFLKNYAGTVVAVTHDRYFLDNIAGWILELDRGHGIPWEGNYSSWLDQKQKRLVLEEKTETKRQKTLERELEWIRMSPRARQAKSKARITAYENLLAEDSIKRNEEMEIYIPPGPRLGNVVIETDGLKKAYGEKILFDDLSFKLKPGSIVGVIGGNGVGKTTLFRLITGQEKPDAGAIRLGDTVKLAYVDQSRDLLDPEKSVWETISDGKNEVIMLGNREVQSRAYCARFNFTGGDQQKKVSMLSGGERNRVHLAKILKSGGNVLLLDEPTNDLDVNTLRALEEALLNFAGCAVVISHDRWFLDRICTHIMAFEDEGRIELFEGNFQEYEEDKKKRLGAESVQPHRVKYKKLTHE
ncbi:MAG: energy-dependent translational throttle protein EttA [Bdellovibrionales bacterium GWB1_52_6]|nr:MAG: energy-dependent translational throttle protein EttA [Bdellovibrionales bacterium GWB1_52_6]OFZ04122.1 MAG: energy-dependent translational throttle protein EttA [Bdellovibrionales bacterium GWA1_52_35]HCM40461.1 energy-dependent translational throttle protein EttA [Bdellovibrionales bacterium]